MKIHYSIISLFFLWIVALVGTLLRSTFFLSLSFEYTHLVHAHSHVAFQGWVYTILMLLLIHIFFSKDQIRKSRYLLQFKLTIITIIGIFISFALQGYALYSITFSTLFQLLNYWFIYCFFRDIKKIPPITQKRIPLLFIKTGLWLGLLSTFLPIGIGILSARGQSGTEIYQSFIYTFLHLQYNGWFLFVCLGLLYQFFNNNKIRYHYKSAIKFYWFFTLAVIPAIALSLLGMSFSKTILPLGYVSAGLQLAGILFFIMSLSRDFITKLRQKNKWVQFYFTAFILLFSLKIILQSLSVFPLFKSYAFFNKPIILAYLHLSLIGVISFLLLGFIFELKWITINQLSTTGNVLFVLGFIATEVLLTLNGFELAQNYTLLFTGSAAMMLGIFLMIIRGNHRTKHHIQT